jgi:DNA modification methylase
MRMSQKAGILSTIQNGKLANDAKAQPELPVDQILQGHVLDVLKTLPDESVNCCITSPPYWSLRDYSLPPMVWDADPNCNHRWGDPILAGEGYSSGQRKRWQHKQNREDNPESWQKRTEQGQFCASCGAWRGSLGLEPTSGLYVKHIVEVFHEVRRVLRRDDVLFLNLADSYAGVRGATQHSEETKTPTRLNPKDLVGIPWQVAFALRADGWRLRSDLIWAKGVSGQKETAAQVHDAALKHVNEKTAQSILKDLDLYVGNPMPESVNGWRWERHKVKVDHKWEPCTGCAKCLPNNKMVLKKGSWRPSRSHEHIFMFVKAERYYANAQAIREPLRDGSPAFSRAGRNRRDVWTITTQPFKGKHFAVFPEKLVEPMILAACPQGVCKKCGEPEAVIVEDSVLDMGKKSADKTADCVAASETSALRYKNKIVERTTAGYRPLCNCNAGFEPGIVLDPFAGAGTTCAVAKKLGRHYLGIELNPEYVKMAEKRIRAAGGLCSSLLLIHGFYAFLRRIWVKHWSAMTSPYVSCTIFLSTSSCRLIEEMYPGFEDIARPIDTRAGWIYSGNEADLSGEPT